MGGGGGGVRPARLFLFVVFFSFFQLLMPPAPLHPLRQVKDKEALRALLPHCPKLKDFVGKAGRNLLLQLGEKQALARRDATASMLRASHLIRGIQRSYRAKLAARAAKEASKYADAVAKAMESGSVDAFGNAIVVESEPASEEEEESDSDSDSDDEGE